MATPFSQGNQDFSDLAHEAAQSLIYPKVFGCDRSLMAFSRASVSEGGERAILDGQMAVDRLVAVTVPGLRGPVEHMVQERFRRTKYAHYRDITITEWNCDTNQKSELYKIKAGLFLYGYFDESRGEFGEVIVINTSALLFAISTGSLNIGRPRKNERSNQTFVSFSFADLHRAGVVEWDSKSHLSRDLEALWSRTHA